MPQSRSQRVFAWMVMGGDRQRLFLFWTVFVVALAVRVWLIWLATAVFDFDAFFRVFHKNELMVGHWLPLAQLPVWLFYHFGWSVKGLEITYALFSATGLGLCALVIWQFSNNYGLALMSGLALGAQGAMATYAIMPYQEGLWVALVAGAFLQLSNRPMDRLDWRLSLLLALGVACRYESWVLLGFIVFWAGWARQWRLLAVSVPAIMMAGIMLLCRFWGAGPSQQETAQIVGYFVTEGHTVSSFFNDLTWLIGPFSIMLARQSLFFIVGIGGVAVLLVRWRALDAVFRTGLLFFGALVALALWRSVNFQQVEMRMTMLLSIGIVPLGVWVLSGIANRIGLSRTMRNGVLGVLVVVSMGLWLLEALAIVREQNYRYREEVKLAAQLVNLPKSATVLVRPKWGPLAFSAGSIFANAPTLDHQARRWLITSTQIGAAKSPPDYGVSWTINGYRVKKWSPVKQRQFMKNPMAFRELLPDKRHPGTPNK